mgnify:CR=1 FL=1
MKHEVRLKEEWAKVEIREQELPELAKMLKERGESSQRAKSFQLDDMRKTLKEEQRKNQTMKEQVGKYLTELDKKQLLSSPFMYILN